MTGVIIEHLTQVGGYSQCKLPWDQFADVVLTKRNYQEIEWQEEDEVHKFDDYVAANGDPDTNGLGHQTHMTPQGVKVVLCPKKIGKLIRKHGERIEKKQTLHSGGVELYKGQVDDRWAAIGQEMMSIGGQGDAVSSIQDLLLDMDFAMDDSGRLIRRSICIPR